MPSKKHSQSPSSLGQNWGSLTFEKVTKYLPQFKSAIQVPIYVVGEDQPLYRRLFWQANSSSSGSRLINFSVASLGLPNGAAIDDPIIGFKAPQDGS
jgi:hypothetical protein